MPFSFSTTVDTNTIHMFTNSIDVVVVAAVQADLLRKIYELKKKAKKTSSRTKARKLKKKAKKLQKQLIAIS